MVYYEWFLLKIFRYIIGEAWLPDNMKACNPLLCGDNLGDDKGRLYTNDELHFHSSQVNRIRKIINLIWALLRYLYIYIFILLILVYISWVRVTTFSVHLGIHTLTSHTLLIGNACRGGLRRMSMSFSFIIRLCRLF